MVTELYHPPPHNVLLYPNRIRNPTPVTLLTDCSWNRYNKTIYVHCNRTLNREKDETYFCTQWSAGFKGFYFPTGGEITRARRAMLKWQQCCFVNVKSRSTYLCHRERFVCINNSVGSRINPEKNSKPQFFSASILCQKREGHLRPPIPVPT